MAAVALSKLDLLGEEAPVVLGGGVLAARNRLLDDGVRELLAERAPKALAPRGAGAAGAGRGAAGPGSHRGGARAVRAAAREVPGVGGAARRVVTPWRRCGAALAGRAVPGRGWSGAERVGWGRRGSCPERPTRYAPGGRRGHGSRARPWSGGRGGSAIPRPPPGLCR